MTRRYTAADFEYDCPPELIAQHPLPERADSRLMHVDRAGGRVGHRRFRDLPELFTPGDCLVQNVSRVIPARLEARRENGRPAELLLVHGDEDGTWLAMVHPGGKLKTGRRVEFDDGAAAEIVDVLGGGLRRIRFHGASADDLMHRFGAVPLPPYIQRAPDVDDGERYQTVYACEDGSIAAPTAGLHFTPALLEEIRAHEVTIVDVTLHVGPGTFRPVDRDDLSSHAMHAEWYRLRAESAETIQQTKASGGRVWAVGTTSCRVLEATRGRAGSGWTDLFIHPPYAFAMVDALITNFHLPRSTLLMLVAAFAGSALTMDAYREAVEQRYRFFSYGDAMVIT